MRQRLTVSSNKSREILSTSTYMQGLVCLLIEENTRNARLLAPSIALLFVDGSPFLDQASSVRVSRLLTFIRFEALNILSENIEEIDIKSFFPRRISKEASIAAFDRVLAPLIPLNKHADFITYDSTAVLLDFWCYLNDASEYGHSLTLAALFSSLCRNGCDTFVSAALQPDRISIMVASDKSWELRHLLDAVGQLKLPDAASLDIEHESDTYSDIDTFIVSSMIHLVTTLVRLPDSWLLLSHRTDIIMLLEVITERKGSRSRLHPSSWKNVRDVLAYGAEVNAPESVAAAKFALLNVFFKLLSPTERWWVGSVSAYQYCHGS